MPCVIAYGAAVPWAMQVGLKRRHVVWGLSRRSALAAAREFVQLRKHKTTSPAPFSFPFLFNVELLLVRSLLTRPRLWNELFAFPPTLHDSVLIPFFVQIGMVGDDDLKVWVQRLHHVKDKLE